MDIENDNGGELQEDFSAIDAEFAEITGDEKAGDFNPKAEIEQEKSLAISNEDKIEAANVSAAVYLEIGAALVAMKWPELNLQQPKERLQPKLAAVLVKYDAELPAFLVPYREELALAAEFGACCFGLYMEAQQGAGGEKSKSGEAE